MGIREKLAEKWKTPYFNQKLKSIKFNEVGLRAVKNTSITFDYPITAIAGTNGIGKTTILQLIACLYHNDDKIHSPFLFDAVPSEGRILLRKVGEKLEVIYKPSSSLAFSELTGETVKELTVYVEDKVAKLMLETLLDSATRKRIHIADVGSKENLVRMIGSHYRNDSLGKAVAIADGDLTQKELRGWYKTHMLRAYKGEEFNEEQFGQETKALFTKFAGDNAPEKYMLEKLKENEEYARYIDNSDAFVSFIAHEIELDDHHGLFRVIVKFIEKGLK